MREVRACEGRMSTDYPCPICSSMDWQSTQCFEYHVQDHTARPGKLSAVVDRVRVLYHLLIRNAPEPRVVSKRPLNARQRLRRRVLFENWFAGQWEIVLTARYCRDCGFMAYTPRPTAEDILVKYERLTRSEGGGPQLRTAIGEYLDSKRASRTFETVVRVVGTGKHTVLDYGGADGFLMLPFLEHGCQCSLVDYYQHQIPGVIKIADDTDDLPAGLRFDVIVCSHVLEHVANPLDLVIKLRDLLGEDGVIYAEVPSEIWAGIRIEGDPVTHVNFFTRRSFESLFKAAGCQIADSGELIESGKEVTWLVAGRQAGDGRRREPVVYRGQSADTMRRLRPGRLRSLRRLFQLRVWPRVANWFLARRLRSRSRRE